MLLMLCCWRNVANKVAYEYTVDSGLLLYLENTTVFMPVVSFQFVVFIRRNLKGLSVKILSDIKLVRGAKKGRGPLNNVILASQKCETWQPWLNGFAVGLFMNLTLKQSSEVNKGRDTSLSLFISLLTNTCRLCICEQTLIK